MLSPLIEKTTIRIHKEETSRFKNKEAILHNSAVLYRSSFLPFLILFLLCNGILAKHLIFILLKQ